VGTDVGLYMLVGELDGFLYVMALHAPVVWCKWVDNINMICT